MKQTTTAGEGGKPPIGLMVISLLSLLGLGLNIYLSAHFYAVRAGTAGFRSSCNFGTTMNCDAVAASPYAELMGGIPLSSFGAGWFLGVFVLSIVARLSDWRREGRRVLLAMSIFGALFSAYYFFVMAAVIKTYCVFCLGVEAVSFLSLAFALTLRPESFAKLPPDFSKWKSAGIVAAVSLLVAVVFLKSLDDLNFPHDQVLERASSVLSSPVLSVSADDQFPSMGPKNAPITIVEFSDFQCPFCRLGAFTLNTIFNRYPGKVRVVFRNFPLNSTCNSGIDRVVHEFACDAAKAAYCSAKQEKFEAVYQEFFENQASFSTSDSGKPETLAKDAGANLDTLRACMASPEVGMAIARDVEEGVRLGVASTPTFFINGHKMEGVAPVPVWITMIDRLSDAH